MKDFQLRNDTKLLLRNDPGNDLKRHTKGKKVLFVYGSGSVKKSGCYNEVKNAVLSDNGEYHELGNASRELAVIEEGIRLSKAFQIDMVIGAGGASIMDAAKLIAFGTRHTEDLWDYVKGKKNPYGLEMLPLILIPTYPSSGSEYGLGAVAADARTNDFGIAYGIAADIALLVPKYSLSLGAEMTAYTGLVTLVQLSAATIGDGNPVSYDIGISVIRNVLKATKRLRENPEDINARGVILYGASISTSSSLGLGKEENYAYDIYEVEFIPEVLFGASYRKSLTTLFPRFLKAMAKYHEKDIRAYFKDAFGYESDVEESAKKMIALFSELGVDMYFDGEFSQESIDQIPVTSALKPEELLGIVTDSMR
ncbi:iron-containing alcohol dehydrogenase [Desulfovibrio sp.]|uniref:iron-containing alcohol dehydrogenase n=1 Tax=Desulfovibrio sp. TaxID=885 RepID=UPI0025C4D25C|nr:iron-containing alcohol dehydrogenase [Desulfovibrio sp.]